MSNIDNFEIAFRTNTGSCRGQCACGLEYYNGSGNWDFEEGEIESLENSGAIAVDYSIGYISFEGKFYIDSCDCRNERMEHIVQFIDSHARQIARYLNLESERKLHQAKEIIVNEYT